MAKEEVSLISNKKTRVDWLRILILITIWIFIAVLVSMMTTVLKYKQLIATDPLNYGMELHHFPSCSCIDSTGRIWNSIPNSSGFVSEQQNLYGLKLGGS